MLLLTIFRNLALVMLFTTNAFGGFFFDSDPKPAVSTPSPQFSEALHQAHGLR